jgi:hypothetical protein
MDLADTLCALALENSGKSLEVLIAAGKEQNIGVVRLEETTYLYHMTWQNEGSEVDLLVEVFEVIFNKRKDRKPKLKLVATRQFTEKK